MDFSMFVILAVLVEAVWENLKPVIPDAYRPDKLGVLILSVVFTMAAGLDLFEVVGIELRIPELGCFATGILLSRGSNFIHDIIEVIESQITR